MRVKTLHLIYGRTFNIGNFESVKIEAGGDFEKEEGESAKDFEDQVYEYLDREFGILFDEKVNHLLPKNHPDRK